MTLSLDQCIKRIKEVYPSMHPTHWVEFGGKYLFNIINNGESRDSAIMDFHIVDPETGGVSGSIPLDHIVKNDKLMALLKKPHAIIQRDTSLSHYLTSSCPSLSNGGHYYAVVRSGDQLNHYGIKGQKWGVRRFQNEDGSLTDEGKKRYYSDRNQVDRGILEDPEMAYAVAELTATAAFVVGVTIYSKIRATKNHKEYKIQNDAISKDYLSDISEIKEFSNENKPKSISGDHSREDDMNAVNPKYGLPVKGNSSNCALCSVTYDLRRRGYDVTAKLCTTGMYSNKLLKEVYKKAKFVNVGARNWNAVTKKCEKTFPEGSRGLIGISSVYGGHAMAFEINNGKLEIFDAQTSQKRKLTDKELSLFNPSWTQAARLDDKEVNWEKASVACAELKDNWKDTVTKQKVEFKAKKEAKKAAAKEKVNKKIAAGSRQALNMKQILEYKREHPGTKLTDKEILNNILGG